MRSLILAVTLFSSSYGSHADNEEPEEEWLILENGEAEIQPTSTGAPLETTALEFSTTQEDAAPFYSYEESSPLDSRTPNMDEVEETTSFLGQKFDDPHLFRKECIAIAIIAILLYFYMNRGNNV